ncbi:MAG: DUF1569 domain-containing protein [Vicinamibacterales bacterium]
MPTLWNEADRTALVARAGRLTPAAVARWGRFSVGGMLAHLNDATRMATGDLAAHASAPAFLRWPPVRYLFLHVLPMPKGAPTSPDLLTRTSAADLTAEQAAFGALVDEAARRPALAPAHPAFGTMSREDWGVLLHKHIDHHLRQFGA